MCPNLSQSRGFKQLKAALSTFKYLKNCLDGDLVSFPSFRFPFRELKTHKIAFCTRVCAIFYFFEFNVLCNPRKITPILCLSLSAGEFWREFYVKA